MGGVRRLAIAAAGKMPRLYASLLPFTVYPDGGGPYEKFSAEDAHATNRYSQKRNATFGVNAGSLWLENVWQETRCNTCRRTAGT